MLFTCQAFNDFIDMDAIPAGCLDPGKMGDREHDDPGLTDSVSKMAVNVSGFHFDTSYKSVHEEGERICR